jgi:hypothetical protein
VQSLQGKRDVKGQVGLNLEEQEYILSSDFGIGENMSWD